MQLAEKQDMTASKNPPKDADAPADSKSLTVYANKPKASPAASLSAHLIPRRQDSWGGVQVAQIEQQARPQAPRVHVEPAVEPPPRMMPEVSDEPESPMGARPQQAILEQAFDELEPVAATAPIERSEFQSARDSAADWSMRSGPSSSYWERIIRDVSIFTIFFAVLVFAILQTM